MTYTNTKRNYNLTISRLSAKDLVLHPLLSKPIVIPDHVDLRLKPQMPPIYDQGQLGSCSANALCAAFEFDSPNYMGSRLFLYYNERKLENDIADDAGALLSDGVKCLSKYGVCPETEWPYDITKFAVAPPAECYTDARAHHVVAAHNIPNDLASMKKCLAAGFPIVVGVQIYESFESDAVAATGEVSMPLPGEKCLGGHAVCIVGYKDATSQWIMRNSWGLGWGADASGYFYLPYAYLLDPSSASDMWTITSVKK